MITWIQLLRNIGQFDSVVAGASISLGRLTVLYSENGRGKTTLAAILRSLSTGDPLPIAERKRLAAQHPPRVVLECTGGPPPAIFENNAWNRTLPDLVVFDDVFIDQNVHSGLAVQTHHRQNLHELILGTQAVALNKRLQQLVERIENHNRDLNVKERAIPAPDRGPFSLDDFCALPVRADIAQAVQEAERALAGAREQDAIRTTPAIDSLSLPVFDLGEIERILQQDLPALDTATLARVQAHLIGLGDGSEAWVADGMHRVPRGDGGGVNELCPFCAQSLGGSPLIAHYRAYFGAEYARLKRTVSDVLGAVNRSHGGDVAAGFERAVRVAVERRQFWARFCLIADISIDTATVAQDWRAARETVVSQLTAKQAAPLERMQLSDETRRLVAVYDTQRAAIAVVNARIRDANLAIGIAKERAATASSNVLSADVARLKAVKARHEPATAIACADYLRERTAKEATEQQRDQTRAALEQHRAAVFPGYQTATNLYLGRFGADFRLDSVTYANTRGGSTCVYKVIINNTPIVVGGADALPGEPSFRNTLSAGDRNTLALAFFFASLDQDPRLANRIVIIDDPISSLDEHRALTTVQEIRRFADRAAQIIVLSHNKPFLCRLWETADPTIRAALEVARDSVGSTLRQWDVAEDAITEHDRRHSRLRDYVASGARDKRDIARSIRPHLEAFLRVACPQWFHPGTLLGPFRDICRQRLQTPDRVLDEATLQEVDDIAEYANRFHHDTNPAWETEVVNDGQLRVFVERTLKFARK